MTRVKVALAVTLATIAIVWPERLQAQTLKTPVQLLEEQGDLWISPSEIRHRDLKWLLPLAAGTGVLFATDWRVTQSAAREPGTISKVGGALPLWLASGALFGVGKLTGNVKASHTGILSADAILQSSALVAGLKTLFNRERPNKIDGHGEFWDGGRSFPSGHTTISFAFASVVTHEYPHKPLVVIGAYGMATAVGLSRVGSLDHFPSDVLIGAAIGELVGRFVVHRH